MGDKMEQKNIKDALKNVLASHFSGIDYKHINNVIISEPHHPMTKRGYTGLKLIRHDSLKQFQLRVICENKTLSYRLTNDGIELSKDTELNADDVKLIADNLEDNIKKLKLSIADHVSKQLMEDLSFEDIADKISEDDDNLFYDEDDMTIVYHHPLGGLQWDGEVGECLISVRDVSDIDAKEVIENTEIIVMDFQHNVNQLFKDEAVEQTDNDFLESLKKIEESKLETTR